VDTITHVALGACLGEVLAGKQLGKTALILGGVAQIIPDVDFIFSLWMEPSSNVLAHRGFTHSFLFGLLIAPLLAWCFHLRGRSSKASFKFWLSFFSVQVFVHMLLDAFNAYGTGWFEPFSHYRVSFNTLFVADPFYSIHLGVSCLALLMLDLDHRRRFYWAMGGIIISTLYLGYGLINKFQIDAEVKGALAQQNIPHHQYFTTPTPFNNWLWFVVASNDSGSYVGYRSVFDQQDNIDFQFFPRKDSLLKLANNQDEVKRLKRFSQGYYTLEMRADTLIFNDLRFGQMIGWQEPRAGFVFHFYLSAGLDNRLVLQRGRFANWDQAATRALLRRIKGIE